MTPPPFVIEQVLPAPPQASHPAEAEMVAWSITESDDIPGVAQRRRRLHFEQRMQAACDKRAQVASERAAAAPKKKARKRKTVPGTAGLVQYIGSDSDPRTSSGDDLPAIVPRKVKFSIVPT